MSTLPDDNCVIVTGRQNLIVLTGRQLDRPWWTTTNTVGSPSLGARKTLQYWFRAANFQTHQEVRTSAVMQSIRQAS